MPAVRSCCQVPQELMLSYLPHIIDKYAINHLLPETQRLITAGVYAQKSRSKRYGKLGRARLAAYKMQQQMFREQVARIINIAKDQSLWIHFKNAPFNAFHIVQIEYWKSDIYRYIEQEVSLDILLTPPARCIGIYRIKSFKPMVIYGLQSYCACKAL